MSKKRPIPEWKKTEMNRLHMYDLRLPGNATVSVHCAYGEDGGLLSTLGMLRFGKRNEDMSLVRVLVADAAGMDEQEAIRSSKDKMAAVAMDWLKSAKDDIRAAAVALRHVPGNPAARKEDLA